MATALAKMAGSKGPQVGRNTSAENLDTYTGRLGAAIRARREAKKVSVSELAEACKVRDSAVYAWESGQNAVPVNALPLIAAKLSTTIAKLLPAE